MEVSLINTSYSRINTTFDGCSVRLNSTHFLTFGGSIQNPNRKAIDLFYQSNISPIYSLNASDTFHWQAFSSFSAKGVSCILYSKNIILLLFGTGNLLHPLKSPNGISVYNLETGFIDSFNWNSNIISPRHHHVSNFNTKNNRTFVFGGITNSGKKFRNSISESGTVDYNGYYFDYVSPNTIQNSTFWPNITWSIIPPNITLMEAGQAAASSVTIDDYILYCFGSSNSRPTNRCTLFNTFTMNYEPLTYVGDIPPEREGASMVYNF